MNEATIAIADLAFSYEKEDFHLRVMHFAMQQGESVALIGPSGSGKTTFLHLIAGILVPSEGTIRVNDCRVSSQRDADRREFRLNTIGMVFQEFELIEYLTVLDNILLPYRLTKSLVLTREVRDRAVDLAKRVGLADELSRHPTKLSHGERQRVAFCRGLIVEPSLILADEPTGNLDPENKLLIVDLLRSYSEEYRIALLMVTHDHSLLKQFDRVVDFSSITQDRVDVESSFADADESIALQIEDTEEAGR